jgi:hypothetical protein
VKSKYREVAINPHGEFHFHTGRPLAARLGYDTLTVDALSDAAVESFAGVANPFSVQPLQPGARVIDVGSGGGFDCLIAAGQVGPMVRPYHRNTVRRTARTSLSFDPRRWRAWLEQRLIA